MKLEESFFVIDLTKLDAPEDCLCPLCKTDIFPYNETGENHNVIETKTGKNNSSDKIVVLCKKCGSVIHLVGLEAFSELYSSFLEILVPYS